MQLFKKTQETGVNNMEKITAILIGAGQRGAWAYASYALQHHDELALA